MAKKRQKKPERVEITVGASELVDSGGVLITTMIEKLQEYLLLVPEEYRHTAHFVYDKYEMYYEGNWEVDASIVYFK